MLSAADIERRLLAALAEPTETAEERKRAFLDAIRVLSQGDEPFAIAGDLGLWLRAMRPGSMRLELAVGSLEGVPWGILKSEGFTVGKTTCSRQGTKIRFRAVRPVALARAETFGRLSVLGASDLLAGKLEDAAADWMPPGARRMAVVEAERLLAQNPEAADDVPKAKKTLDEAREKLRERKEEPMKKTKLQTMIGIAKELMSLFGIFVLLAGCDGGGGTVEVDGGGQGTGGAVGTGGAKGTGGAGGQGGQAGQITCKGGTLCPVGACLVIDDQNGPDRAALTGYCCNGCPDTNGCASGVGATTDLRSCEVCHPFGEIKGSNICTIGPLGVQWAPAPQTACNGCYQATDCPPGTINPDAICGTCHPSGDKATFANSTFGPQTVTCRDTSWTN
jgi:hypothetical protein